MTVAAQSPEPVIQLLMKLESSDRVNEGIVIRPKADV